MTDSQAPVLILDDDDVRMSSGPIGVASSLNSTCKPQSRTAGTKRLDKERVKKSCALCRAARRACSNERPCQRCVSRGTPDLCTDNHVSVSRTVKTSFTPHNMTVALSMQYGNGSCHTPENFNFSYPNFAPFKHPHGAGMNAIAGLNFDSNSLQSTPWIFDDINANISDGTLLEHELQGFVPELNPCDPNFASMSSMSSMSCSLMELRTDTTKLSELAGKIFFVLTEMGDGNGVPIIYTDPDWSEVNKHSPLIKEVINLVSKLRLLLLNTFAFMDVQNHPYSRMECLKLLKDGGLFNDIVGRLHQIMDTLLMQSVFRTSSIEAYIPEHPLDEGGSPRPSLVWDFNLRILDVNSAFCSLSGYSLEHIKSIIRVWSDILAPSEMENFIFIHCTSVRRPVLFYECPVTIVTQSSFKLQATVHVNCIRAVPDGLFSYAKVVIFPAC